jgi:hypothetical protein
MVFIVFMAALMLNYNTFQKAPYLMVYIPLAMLFFKLIQNKGFNFLKKNKVDNYFSIVMWSSFAYICISGVMQNKTKYFFLDYSMVYMVIIYLHVSYMNYGIKFAERLFKQLTLLLNFFSVINLYQVFFHKAFFISHMHIEQGGYQYNFGTDQYRTMSVYGHPIVAGLFFVITFFCNIYVIKSSFKYILQFLLLVNIYSTSSRSAWLSMLIVLLVYLLMNSQNISKRISNFKLTYKNLFNMYFSFIFIACGLIFVVLNFDHLYNSIVLRIGDSLSSNTTDVSSLQRTETVSTILKYIFGGSLIHLFFGYGMETVGNFMLSHTIIIPDFTTTDNQYLTWSYELGILGISIYLVTLVYLLVKGFKNRFSWVQELSILCLITISIESLFFESFAWKPIMFILAIVVSCLSFNFKNSHAQSLEIREEQIEISKKVS